MNMQNFAGSKTAANLAKAFAGESMARNRYLFYSETAQAEGLVTIGKIFLETADDERGHGEAFYDYLTEGLNPMVMELPKVSVPIAKGDTALNLSAAIQGEYGEWSELYPEFGKIAEQEGFYLIAKSFISIAEVEKRHDRRFRRLLKDLQNNKMYMSDTPVMWQCTNCGYRHHGLQAPVVCPACRHPQQFYMNMSVMD